MQPHVWRRHDAPAALPHRRAEIGTPDGPGEPRVEATGLLEQPARDHHAVKLDSRDILERFQSALVRGKIVGVATVQGHDAFARASDAKAAHLAIPVQELGPDHADARALAHAEQLLDRLRGHEEVARLQKQQVRAVRGRRPHVEFFRSACRLCASNECVLLTVDEIGVRKFLRCDNDYLEVGVTVRLGKIRERDGGFLGVVISSDDDRDQILCIWGKPQRVQVDDLCGENRRMLAHALQVTFRAQAGGDAPVGLRARICGGRFLAHAQVIEHAGDVVHHARPLDRVENHVVVLRAVEHRRAVRDVLHDRPANGHEVDGVVLAQQVFRRVVRFEEGVHVVTALVIDRDQVLVAVQDVDERVALEGGGKLEQRVRLEEVVMVEEAQKVAARRLDAAVRILGDAVVAVEDDVDDLFVVACQLLDFTAQLVVFGRRVDQHELVALVRLRLDGANHRAQVVERRFEEGHDDAERGRGIETVRALRVERLGRRLVPLEPLLIVGVGPGIDGKPVFERRRRLRAQAPRDPPRNFSDYHETTMRFLPRATFWRPILLETNCIAIATRSACGVGSRWSSPSPPRGRFSLAMRGRFSLVIAIAAAGSVLPGHGGVTCRASPDQPRGQTSRSRRPSAQWRCARSICLP